MQNQFLDQANQGRNEFWRYLLTILAIIWVSISVQVAIALPAMMIEGSADINQFSPLMLLVIAMVPFLFAMLTLWGGLRLLHKRPLVSIINPSKKIDWRRILFSGLLWFGLSAAGDAIIALFLPGNYAWTFDFSRFLPYFIAGLVLIPIQTSTEEFLFRGYLTQWMGRFSKALWLPLVAPSIVFALLHSLNPEVSAYGLLMTMPLYLGIGLLLGWITLRSQGLELALGLHAANNLYAAMLVTFPNSSLPSPAIFTMLEYKPIIGLIAFAIMSVVYLLVLYLFKRSWFSPIEVFEGEQKQED